MFYWKKGAEPCARERESSGCVKRVRGERSRAIKKKLLASFYDDD